jgi:hypothetical protein
MLVAIILKRLYRKCGRIAIETSSCAACVLKSKIRIANFVIRFLMKTSMD